MAHGVFRLSTTDNALKEAAKIARKCGNDDIARQIRALKTNKGGEVCHDLKSST